MAKIKLGISDEEFERQYAKAVKRGKERLKTEPRAKSAAYDPKTRRLIIELMNDCVFIVPVDLMQGLREASDEDLTDFSLMPRGFDLHWHKLDAQFTVFGLMQGRFGTKRWMAELERASHSKTKRAASQANSRSRAAATTKGTKKRRYAA